MRIKLTQSFLCLAALTLGFASCNPDEIKKEPKELPAPVLKIDAQDESSFTVSWTAVENAEGYTYIFQDGEKTATQDLSISFTDLTADIEYTVRVKANANSEEWLDSKFADLKVTLQKPEQPKVTLALEATEITYESVKIIVTPSDDNAIYYVENADNEFINEYDSLEEFIKSSIDMYLNLLGMSVSELTVSGKSEKSFKYLDSDTDHTAFAVCLNEDGSLASDIFTVEYRTEKEEQLPFEISVSEITDVSARVSVIPADKEVVYYYDCLRSDLLAGYDTIEDYLLQQFKFFDIFGGIEFYKGDNAYTFPNLSEETDYTVVAIGVHKDEDKNYTFTTELVTYEFKTEVAASGSGSTK